MTPSPIKPLIGFDVLERIDIRVGTIEAVEEVANSNKLMRLIVRFGDHRRRILAGIRQERANPQEIVGRQALFVVNLEPKRMAGEVGAHHPRTAGVSGFGQSGFRPSATKAHAGRTREFSFAF
jgi:tRNA-binding protein